MGCDLFARIVLDPVWLMLVALIDDWFQQTNFMAENLTPADGTKKPCSEAVQQAQEEELQRPSGKRQHQFERSEEIKHTHTHTRQ